MLVDIYVIYIECISTSEPLHPKYIISHRRKQTFRNKLNNSLCLENKRIRHGTEINFKVLCMWQLMNVENSSTHVSYQRTQTECKFQCVVSDFKAQNVGVSKGAASGSHGYSSNPTSTEY